MKNMTKVEALNFAIENCELPCEVKEKFEQMRDTLIAQAASKAEHKTPTKTQKENEILKADIVAFLASGEHKTVSEIISAVPSLAGSTTQKVSALMRLLKMENRVDKEVVKGKTLFFLI